MLNQDNSNMIKIKEITRHVAFVSAVVFVGAICVQFVSSSPFILMVSGYVAIGSGCLALSFGGAYWWLHSTPRTDQCSIQKTSHEVINNMMNTSPGTERSGTVYAGFEWFYAEVVALFSDQNNHVNQEKLDDAILKFEEERDRECFDVTIISDEFEKFDRDSRALVQQFKLQESPRLAPQFFNAETRAIDDAQTMEIAQQKAELVRLLGSYPEFDFTVELSVDIVEQHTDRLKEHHEQVLSIAAIILTNINSVLNEARLARDRQPSPAMTRASR